MTTPRIARRRKNDFLDADAHSSSSASETIEKPCSLRDADAFGKVKIFLECSVVKRSKERVVL